MGARSHGVHGVGTQGTQPVHAVRATGMRGCQVPVLHRDITAVGIAHQCIRPHRPETNGKVERFTGTLLDAWAYLRPCTSNER